MSGESPVLITGGAGFIGANLADSFLNDGREVLILDALARPGVESNLAWLTDRHGNRVGASIADIRDEAAVEAAAALAGAVIHLAGQVAVTTSLGDPMEDFAINAAGTLNVLEALRRRGARTPLLFASTNKVYGDLADLLLGGDEDHHRPADPVIARHGIGESRPLDFHTPYGCSKGVADQYVLDYARSYGLPTAVLRMSCIYGPRQFGTEDQGWVAHFLIRALSGEPITIYGDGRQVRDVLHVSDAVAAYRLVLDRIDEVTGQAFNLGGGAENAVSLRQVLREIERFADEPLDVSYSEARPGDQLYFVADTRKIEAALGWAPRVAWREGLQDLATWLVANGRARGASKVRRISA